MLCICHLRTCLEFRYSDVSVFCLQAEVAVLLPLLFCAPFIWPTPTASCLTHCFDFGLSASRVTVGARPRQAASARAARRPTTSGSSYAVETSLRAFGSRPDPHDPQPCAHTQKTVSSFIYIYLVSYPVAMSFKNNPALIDRRF